MPGKAGTGREERGEYAEPATPAIILQASRDVLDVVGGEVRFARATVRGGVRCVQSVREEVDQACKAYQKRVRGGKRFCVER